MATAFTHFRSALLFGLTVCAVPATSLANTVCTYISNSAEMPVPFDERESIRTVQSQVLPAFIELGDGAVAKDELAEAAYQYAKVFGPFFHKGLHYSRVRCADRSVYQNAADNLRRVAREYAPQLIARGHYLTGDSPREVEGLPGGALHLLLIANDYQGFIDRSLEYAAMELRERDIETQLNGMVNFHLRELDSMRNLAPAYLANGLKDDSISLLAEELAAFNDLADYAERLRAHVAPLYPKITDYWLAEESQRHQALVAMNSDFERSLLVDPAAGALDQGIGRLRRHPREVERLTARGNQRGEAFFSSGQYTVARAYFKAVGNSERAEEAKTLASAEAKKKVDSLKRALRVDIEKMQKSDQDRAIFDEEADDMAKEFGFD